MSFHVHIQAYSYLGREPVLENIDLQWSNGETIAVLGPSGCGKSTFLRVLMGFEKGAQGFLTLGSPEKFSLESWTDRQRIFGLVPQTPHLFPWKTISENLELAIDPKIPLIERRQRVQAVLLKIGLEGEQHKYPSEISVGMASRVSFARTLLVGCDVLLLDEPFAALDALTRSQMQMWFLSQLKHSQVRAAIFVTHDVREALLLADKIIVLSRKPAQQKILCELNNKSANLKEWQQSEQFFVVEKKIIACLEE